MIGGSLYDIDWCEDDGTIFANHKTVNNDVCTATTSNTGDDNKDITCEYLEMIHINGNKEDGCSTRDAEYDIQSLDDKW